MDDGVKATPKNNRYGWRPAAENLGNGNRKTTKEMRLCRTVKKKHFQEHPILEGQGEFFSNFPRGRLRDITRADQGNQYADPPMSLKGQNLAALPIYQPGPNNFNRYAELAKYFHSKPVVVEIKNGETREDAWRRHLLSHPENARAEVKIFHRPWKDSQKPESKKIEDLPGK